MRELRQDWRDLFLGFKLARDAKRLITAFCGVLLGVILLALVEFAPLWVSLAVIGVLVWGAASYRVAKSKSPGTMLQGLALALGIGLTILAILLIGLLASQGMARLIKYGVDGVVVLILVAFFGGAITRSAAVELVTDEIVDVRKALAYGGKKFKDYLLSLLGPFLAILALGLIVFLVALFPGRVIPFVGEIFVGIFYFLALFAGLLMVLVAIGILGLGLMPVSVSVEGTDAFDAWSRIYSYIFARPWRFIFYHLIGFAYGIASLFFIKIFTVKFVQATAWCVERGMGGKFSESIWPSVVAHIGAVVQPIDSRVLRLLEGLRGIPVAGWAADLWARYSVPPVTGPEPLGVAGGIAWFFIFLYAIIIVGFVISFGVSLFFSLETIIYLLLRKVHDGTDFTEIYTEEVEEEELETVAEEAPEEEKPAEEEEEPEEEKPAEEEKPEE